MLDFCWSESDHLRFKISHKHEGKKLKCCLSIHVCRMRFHVTVLIFVIIFFLFIILVLVSVRTCDQWLH